MNFVQRLKMKLQETQDGLRFAIEQLEIVANRLAEIRSNTAQDGTILKCKQLEEQIAHTVKELKEIER